MSLSLVFRFLLLLLALQMALVGVLAGITDHAPSRAILLMGMMLMLMWVVLGGGVMYRWRDVIRQHVRNIPAGWRVKFVLFATVLALMEEAITTTLSNLAPIFGVAVGEAYITASPNYLEVVALHSVVVFIPMFIGWSWLLGGYDFAPGTVLVLFGLTGFLGEMISFGAQITALPMWIFIYGLLVYLPVYSLPSAEERQAKPPRWYHYPLAVLLPILCALPVVMVVSHFHPTPTQFAPLVFPEM